MDVRFINPFIASIRNVFKTMLHMEVAVDKPFISKGDMPNADVSAVIGLSDDVTGSVALCFPAQTAARAASAFAGIEMDQNHEDFSDALGELVNMVAGNAKAQFEGFHVSISLPTVIVGTKHVLSHSRHQPRLAIPCNAPVGPFTVEVAFLAGQDKPDRRSAPAAASV